MKNFFSPVVLLGLTVLCAALYLGLQGPRRDEVIVFSVAAVAAGAALSLFLWSNRRVLRELLVESSGKKTLSSCLQVLLGKRLSAWARLERDNGRE